jgi:hypothetical protein
MTAQALALAAAAGFLLAAAAVAIFCLWRAGQLLRLKPPASAGPASEAAIEVLQQKLDALEQRVQELRQHGLPAAVPGPPRAGFNLEKRSHALRMHRRGEPLPQIASTLELPLQEVELLIKVHRIVLRNI